MSENNHIESPGQSAAKDPIFDIKGLCSGIPVTKRLLLSIAAAVAAFIALSMLPLDRYGANTAKGLGFLVFVLIIMIFMPTQNLVVPSLIIPVFGFITGLWDMDVITTGLGNSPFYQITGIMIVAMGCEFTPVGRRIAYWLLKKFGRKPTQMLVVIGFAMAFISAFLSNVADIIVMSTICVELLTAMNEKPGESKFGRCLMLLSPTASMIGGASLILGSPVGNILAINFMSAASNGAYTVTFGQWALMAIPCTLVILLPMCWIYIKYFKVNNSDIKALPESYYDTLLKEMGPVGGSEIRWVVTLLAMIGFMAAGFNSALVALAFALITLLPVVGTVSAEKCFKRLPFDLLLPVCMIPLIGNLFTSTGLGALVSDLIAPLIRNFGPLGFSIVAALIMGILVNAFVNANMAVSALVISAVTPVCIALGYNPTVVLFPVMLIASFFFVMGPNSLMMINYGYGYWRMKDPILPGTMLILPICIVYPLICCLIGPIIGIPLYI